MKKTLFGLIAPAVLIAGFTIGVMICIYIVTWK